PTLADATRTAPSGTLRGGALRRSRSSHTTTGTAAARRPAAMSAAHRLAPAPGGPTTSTPRRVSAHRAVARATVSDRTAARDVFHAGTGPSSLRRKNQV